ncbi:Type I secretion membrane fusion protein, HlyD family precursor [Nitratireductor basaltis]|uniref:Membrane fusion protein (MFP) family protein n=2 Tax=Nitratireductor basaltis TaxID=472175 RepID=A0A084U641_9HYPH|nr:Type I secretion membrane fusion protein, HlyD family precursor [Nitratireductor basaltis]
MTRKGSRTAPTTYRLGSRVVAGSLLGLLLVGGVGGWAATAQLTGAVIAQGVVAVDQKLKTIQHRDGGIISAINVREGDQVSTGQILFRLEDAQTKAELSIVNTQLSELVARRARLVAERDMLPAMVFPADFDLNDPANIISVSGEQRLFEGNKMHRESQKQQLELGIVQIGEEITGLEAQKESKSSEAEIVEAEYQKIKGLADKRLIEGSRVYTATRERARLLGERGEIDAAIARAKTRMSEIRLQIIAIDENGRTEAQRELSLVETRISELQDRSTAIADRLTRTDIRSPIDGIVNELNIHTLGGVITPAEVLANLVPLDAKLKVEVKLPPTAIDQVNIGQDARLRFSAFNQRTTPELDGNVTYVAAATSHDQSTGETYYLGNVEVAAAELEKLGDQTLMPGMPVEIFISTEERTALSYITKPFVDQLNRAFREE